MMYKLFLNFKFTFFRLICLGLIGTVAINGCGENKNEKFKYFQNFSKTFSDMNDRHLISAKRLGVSPVMDEDEIDSRKRLQEISSCRFYEIDNLTHSLPYLVPEACELLENIGRNFKDSLDSKGLSSCKIIVTSVLRTKTSVKQLRKKNSNASVNSAHIYGTTFDIAYTRYDGGREKDSNKLKTVLAEVLRDLRKKKQCYIRYEYKQGCFHITAR